MTRLRSILFLTVLVAACSKAPDLVRMPEEPASTLVVANVAVLDVESGERVDGLDVVVTGGIIEAIRESGSGPLPEGAQRIDGSGATLLPGLIDMHGHVGNSPAPVWSGAFPDPEWNLRAYLYAGVTTVLDPCDLSSEAFLRRDAVARGEILGPRIYTAGPMVTAHGGHPVPIVREVAPWWIRWYLVPRIALEIGTPDEARAAVASLAEWKADVVKLAVDRIPADAPRLNRELLTAAIGEAKRHGIRAVAHIGSTDDAAEAAEAGVAMWMHGVYKERIAEERIAELAAFAIPMVPTTVVFESYALLGQQPRVATTLERETYPAEMLESFDKPPKGYDFDSFSTYLEELRKHRDDWRENVGRLHAAGVPMLAGSDAQSGVFPGAGLHRELALLVESGLEPADAIRAATVDAARFLANGATPAFGTVAPGKVADLILVEGDPLDDIAKLAAIRLVIKGGVALERTPIVN